MAASVSLFEYQFNLFFINYKRFKEFYNRFYQKTKITSVEVSPAWCHISSHNRNKFSIDVKAYEGLKEAIAIAFKMIELMIKLKKNIFVLFYLVYLRPLMNIWLNQT